MGWPTDILCEGPAIGNRADLEAERARERRGGSERDLTAYRNPLAATAGQGTMPW